jgi:hypothetical protein
LTLEGKYGAWSLIKPGPPTKENYMRKSAIVSKQKRSTYSMRLGVAANFIAAYVELPEDFREFFERSLALQAYGEDGCIHISPPQPAVEIQ